MSTKYLLLIWQVNKTSIIVDAAKYIEELKEKIDKLNEELGTSTNQDLPMVCLSIYRRSHAWNNAKRLLQK